MSRIDATNDPALASWASGAEPGSDFPVQNLPLGIFSTGDDQRRAGVAIGDFILDLAAIADAGLIEPEWRDDPCQPVLNAWLARGPEDHSALRRRLSEMLTDERNRDAIEVNL